MGCMSIKRASIACLMTAVLFQYLFTEGYITGIAVRLWLQGERSPPGSPWPLPQIWQNSSSLKTINPENFLFASSAQCDVILQAFQRYGNWMFTDPAASADPDLPNLEVLYVNLRGCDDGYPSEDMDEYYNLTIDDGGAAILSANSEWGVLRGLETFSQLLFVTEDKKYNINETFIEDSPRFSYRGLMIDTARHYLSLPVILSILDGMSMDKLNVLHWHIVDDQSFPFESRTYPNMSELGAFSPNHTYSHEDVSTVIEEARLRGIRVIPEFDTPGHSYSWGKAFPDLLTPCWGDGLEGGPYVPKHGVHGDMETVNPSQDYTYQLMADIWQEVIEDFPDEYVHLGLDEAYYSCWQSNPNISEWMSEQGFTEYRQVEAYYTSRLTDIVEELGAKVVVWQDPIDNNVTLSNTSIIAVWKDSSFGLPGQFKNWTEYMERITSLGYSTYLLAPWYLNIIKYGPDWQDYYLVDPWDFSDNPDLQSKVLGGSATAWAEYLDGANILSLLWPRLSAMAERLWSSREVRDVETAQFRLDQQRCRFLRRGIPAKPILPGYCGDYEWRMQDEV